MKFIISTLVALAAAIPVTMVKAAQLTVAVESTLDAGLIKVFTSGDFVKLRKGVDPLYTGDLLFTSAQQAQRFDVIDNRKGGLHEGQHYKCKVVLLKDPVWFGDATVKILVTEKLDNPKCIPLDGDKETDAVTVECTWYKDGT